jgi:sec-independent protein translocase protein TatC
MPFLDHLEELRWRLIYALAAFVVGLVVAFALVSKVDVVGFLEQPVLPYLPRGASSCSRTRATCSRSC